MAGLVIRNADWIVTVDRERRILWNGAIAIVDDRISFVGKDDHLPEVCADEACADLETFDAAGPLVLPGFGAPHVHTTQHLAAASPMNATSQSSSWNGSTATSRR